MKAMIPNHVVSYMVRKGIGDAQHAKVILATVAKPKGIEIPDNAPEGYVILLGKNVKVGGRTDETGRFFTVSRVDFTE